MTEDVEPDIETETIESEPAEEDIEGDLKNQVEDLQKLAQERLEQLQRCRAELDNTIKRAAKEKDNYVKYASEKLICKLLSFLDSLEQASKHDEGARVLHQQLWDILQGEGLAPIDSVGKKFDPYRHEALFRVASDELEEDVVAEEIQKGYLLNSKVIRFSKVAVAKR